MNFKSTVIVALLAAGLGSWYYFYEIKGKPAREKAKENVKLVFKDVQRKDISEVKLHMGSGDVTLNKTGEVWQLTQPLISAVDKVVVDSLLDSLYSMKKEETIDEAGANAADFGLSPPHSSATFSAASGTSHTILFGIDNPTGQYSYAQVKGEPAIFVTMKYVKGNVLKEAKDLRDKKVWDFDPASVLKVSSNFAKGLAFERGKDGSFALTMPKAPADQGAINAWLTQLKGLRIDTFVDGGAKSPAKYGLGASARKITIDAGPKAAPLVLIQGRTMDTNKTHYYMLQGGTLVFTMAESFTQMLEKKSEELVKKPDPTPVPAAVTTTASK